MSVIESNKTVGINELTELESETIALAVRNGFRSGVLDNLSWEISIEKIEHDELLQIVELIEEGFTSGYYPTWQLTFQHN